MVPSQFGNDTIPNAAVAGEIHYCLSNDDDGDDDNGSESSA
jgi:hypothetical protein